MILRDNIQKFVRRVSLMAERVALGSQLSLISDQSRVRREAIQVNTQDFAPGSTAMQFVAVT